MDIDVGLGIHMDMDVDSDAAVSMNWGSFERGLWLLERGLGLIQGSFRVDPCI